MDTSEAMDYVERLIADLRDRADLGDVWDDICPEIQEEITTTWINILTEG